MNVGRFNIEPSYLHDAAYVALTGISLYLGVTRHAFKNRLAATETENAQLHHDATHDILTGLPNRSKFISDLNHEVEQHSGDFGLIFVDLDDLKSINDTHGHRAGDTFIQTAATELDKDNPKPDQPTNNQADRGAFRKLRNTVAATIAETVRTKNVGEHEERRADHEREDIMSRVTFRLAGDEFVIIVAGADTQEKVDRVIERLDLALAQKDIKASMDGRAHREGESGMELLNDVDKMMYKKKRARRHERTRQQIAAMPLSERVFYEIGQRSMQRTRFGVTSR